MIVCVEHNNSGLDNELEGKQLVRFELGTSGFYGYIRKGQRYERGKYILHARWPKIFSAIYIDQLTLL